MLVPGISDVFKVFNCSSNARSVCKGLAPGYSINRISAGSWGVDFAMAFGTWLIHFIGRCVNLPTEF